MKAKNKKIAVASAVALGGLLCLSCFTGCTQKDQTPETQLHQSVASLGSSVAKLNLVKDSDLTGRYNLTSTGTSMSSMPTSTGTSSTGYNTTGTTSGTGTGTSMNSMPTSTSAGTSGYGTMGSNYSNVGTNYTNMGTTGGTSSMPTSAGTGSTGYNTMGTTGSTGSTGYNTMGTTGSTGSTGYNTMGTTGSTGISSLTGAYTGNSTTGSMSDINSITTGGMPMQNQGERLMSAHSALRNAKFILQNEMLRTESLTEGLKNSNADLTTSSQNLVDEYSTLLNRISSENRRNTKDYNLRSSMMRETNASAANTASTTGTTSSARIEGLIYTINSNLVALDSSINALRQINMELSNHLSASASMNTTTNMGVNTTANMATTGSTSTSAYDNTTNRSTTLNNTTNTNVGRNPGTSSTVNNYATTPTRTINTTTGNTTGINATTGTVATGTVATGANTTTGTTASGTSTAAAGARTTPNILGESTLPSSSVYRYNNSRSTGTAVPTSASVNEEASPLTLVTASNAS